MQSNDPLYILYTSGHARPSHPLIRDTGSNAVALRYAMNYIFDIHQKETYFAASDIGWVVGH